jgi:hypothetical protein
MILSKLSPFTSTLGNISLKFGFCLDQIRFSEFGCFFGIVWTRLGCFCMVLGHFWHVLSNFGCDFGALLVPFGAFKRLFCLLFARFWRGFGAVFFAVLACFLALRVQWPIAHQASKLVSLSEYNNFSVFTKHTSLIENRSLKTQVYMNLNSSKFTLNFRITCCVCSIIIEFFNTVNTCHITLRTLTPVTDMITFKNS